MRDGLRNLRFVTSTSHLRLSTSNESRLSRLTFDGRKPLPMGQIFYFVFLLASSLDPSDEKATVFTVHTFLF